MDDGFNLESEECESSYIKTLEMTFLYTIFNLLLSQNFKDYYYSNYVYIAYKVFIYSSIKLRIWTYMKNMGKTSKSVALKL